MLFKKAKLKDLRRQPQADFFVWIAEKADLSPAASLPTKAAKVDLPHFAAKISAKEAIQVAVLLLLKLGGLSHFRAKI